MSTSGIPQGMEGADMGKPEQDPLAGSVKINGIRGARLTVPMTDGSLVRARVNLVDESVDIAIRASEETGLRAEQRAGELRQALAEHGIDLGEFDVESSEPEESESAEGDEAADASARDGEESAEAQADRASDPPDELGTSGSGYGYGDDGGPGSLITRRL